MSVSALIASLATLKGARFVSFVYTAKTSGETARHTVLLGADFRNLYEKDAETVAAMLPNLSGLELEAAQAVHSSLCVSLEGGIGENPAYTAADVYVSVPGLAGVKIHRETGELYVMGLAVSKDVMVPGTFKEVKCKPLTLAKKAIEKGLRKSAIRQFAVSGLTTATLNGETIELA